MTASQLNAIVRGLIVPLGAVLKSIGDRIEALEVKERNVQAVGPAGPIGPAGPVGKQGEPGRDGRDGPHGLKGADGLNGKDGHDGLGFDDWSVLQDDEDPRHVRLRGMNGDRIKEYALFFPCIVDKGVFKDGPYLKYEAVSFGGSLFIAQRNTTTERPEDGSGAWRLAVKRGRDGKGVEGKQGPQGPKGDKGDGKIIR